MQSCSRSQQMGSWCQMCRFHWAPHTARSVFTASSRTSNTSRCKPIKLEVYVDTGCIQNVHKTGYTSSVVVGMSTGREDSVKGHGHHHRPRPRQTLLFSDCLPGRHKSRWRRSICCHGKGISPGVRNKRCFFFVCLEQLLRCFWSMDFARHDLTTQWEVKVKELQRRDCSVPKHEN